MSEEEEISSAYKQLEAQIKARKSKGVTGTITGVRLGVLGKFIPVHKLRNPERANKQAVCLEIATPDGYTIKKAMILSSHPNAAIMRYLQVYGDWPKVGQQVRLKFDETAGFWRLDL
ncbi:MAG: hypothetical protein QXJ07_03395 [Candidatus Bathyarchaeia archaeon]